MMMDKSRVSALLGAFTYLSLLTLSSPRAIADTIPAIERRIPPAGIEIPAADRRALVEKLEQTRKRLSKISDHKLAPDVEIYVKAVDLALLHGEFYREKDVAKAHAALATANERLDQLFAGNTPWAQQRGLVVRGYRSSIDGSAQPYGVEIPEDLASLASANFYVWLHGRGDANTDLHFIAQRQSRPGKIKPRGAIVVHPFGRHCIGFKSAGEIDVLDSLAHARSQYQLAGTGDPNSRNVLVGFSMGGAGAWHIGAHYPDMWAAVSPGAGFAETARYNRIAEKDYPVWYEQKLWGLYDVPHYTRNLFNMPVIAYSGEKDKQIQAARVMEEAFAAQGRELPHIIGPGMGHAYHPDSLAEILGRLEVAAAQPGPQRGLWPERVFLQTQTLSYAKAHWLELLGLEQHWRNSQVDAVVKSDGENKTVELTTNHVTRLRLRYELDKQLQSVVIDRQTLEIPGEQGRILIKESAGWTWGEASADRLVKSPGSQGPIDDAFRSPFLIVAPTGKSKSPRIADWVEFEMRHLQDRWRSLYRGEARIKKDTEVTDEDVKQYHLVLWGDRDSNQVIHRLLDRLPLKWDDTSLEMRGEQYSASRHVPLMIYPNPENPTRYVVLNSGPTHREGHDRTNSLQNPKLPDWAVVDVTRSPDKLAPGRVVAADFFDEQWRFKEAESGRE